MGLIAKSQTKKRVAPSSGQLSSALSGSPWLASGASPAAALIRSVVFALNLAGATSSSLRGRQNALAAALVSPLTSFSSKLWVETSDFKTWTFLLGMVNANDKIACDWLVQLRLDESAAMVGTTNWLTKDDALVHGELHDALRNELLRALALGEMADAAGEAEISASSLKLPQRFEDSPAGPVELSFGIVTSLDETVSRKRLAMLGHRVLEDTPGGVRWGIGLPRNEATDYVAFTFPPGRIDAMARVGSHAPQERRIAARALREFISRAVFLVRNEDDAAAYEGPAEWEPRA